MPEQHEPDAAASRALAACRDAAARLAAAGIAPTPIAEYIEPRRVLIFTRRATMRPIGEAWRLGTLLLGSDGSLFALGRATRAAERGRPGYQSQSREERRDLAAAALRGGYAAGESVNFDAQRIPVDAASLASLEPALPVGYADGDVRVRWRAGAPLAGAPTLQAYLDERVELLVHPPLGA